MILGAGAAGRPTIWSTDQVVSPCKSKDMVERFTSYRGACEGADSVPLLRSTLAAEQGNACLRALRRAASRGVAYGSVRGMLERFRMSADGPDACA